MANTLQKCLTVGGDVQKLLPLLAILVLASCIDVDDFGGTWAKTTVDPVLEGRWKKIPHTDEDKEDEVANQQWTFTLKNGAYAVQTYMNGKPDEDGPLYPVKTLVVGHYRFLANGPEKGAIIRYEVEGDRTIWLVLNSRKAWAFIQKNYPDTENLYLDGDEDESADDDKDSKNAKKAPDADSDDDDFPPLKIRTFDREVFKILSEIPDDESYWEPDTELEKIR